MPMIHPTVRVISGFPVETAPQPYSRSCVGVAQVCAVAAGETNNISGSGKNGSGLFFTPCFLCWCYIHTRLEPEVRELSFLARS